MGRFGFLCCSTVLQQVPERDGAIALSAEFLFGVLLVLSIRNFLIADLVDPLVARYQDQHGDDTLNVALASCEGMAKPSRM